jgi:8-oxo-dGTP diphosphatase
VKASKNKRRSVSGKARSKKVPRKSLDDRIKTPKLTVDAIVEYQGKVILIKRKNPPNGWALPGGFVDVGETVEDAVKRELREEANVELTNLRQFHVYSDPKRDPRFHTVSVVFMAATDTAPKAGDDAKEAKLYERADIFELIQEEEICFDHGKILEDYFRIR